MGNTAKIAVLAEDQRHHTFVRHFLKRLAYETRDIRSLPVPAGKGSGEQWVRNLYAKEVKAYRAREARAQSALIVIVDADSGTCAERFQALADALQQAHEPNRGDHERIAIFVPKRAIETWILCLSGKNVDESTDYSDSGNVDDSMKLAAIAFFEWTRPNHNIPHRCIPSLHAAIPEATRLET